MSLFSDINNTTRTLWTSKTPYNASNWVGEMGQIFYNPTTGCLRLSDGVTPGGLPLCNNAPIPFPNYHYGAFHSNNSTSLVAAVPNSSSTLPIHVTSTAGFRSSGWIVLDAEIIAYTGITNNTFTGITRGVSDSNKSSHSIGILISSAEASLANVAARVLLDIADYNNGVTLNPETSEITIVNAGTYNCQFSVELTNFGNSYDDVAVWFVVDNVHVPSSASYATLPQSHAGKPGAVIMTVNIFYTFAAGQKLTLEWMTNFGTSVISAYPPVMSNVPASPGTILTVNQLA